ncbi:hypothetical protein EDD90_10981 [Streptomyces sp. Ag109_O5-1]|nr:hypothetical protein EDD90_10981 [Streptomyces sp. Ag109_O5-1]
MDSDVLIRDGRGHPAGHQFLQLLQAYSEEVARQIDHPVQAQ